MIATLSRGIALAALPFVIAACSVAPKHAPGELGRQFTATIPGTWMGEESKGGISSRMVKQFNPDGSAKGVLMLRKRVNGVTVVMPEIPFTSRWRVKGDVVESYDIKAGVPGLFRKGEVIQDTVLSVSPKRIVSRANTSGNIEILDRLNSSHD